MPAALFRSAAFAPLGAQLRSMPAPPGATSAPRRATAQDRSEIPEATPPRATTIFDLVLQAYVTSPGGD